MPSEWRADSESEYGGESDAESVASEAGTVTGRLGFDTPQGTPFMDSVGPVGRAGGRRGRRAPSPAESLDTIMRTTKGV